jgi:hypothetical protein
MSGESKGKVNEVKCVALGEEGIDAEVEVQNNPPQTTDEKIAMLEQRIFHMSNGLDNLFRMVKELRDDLNKDKDQDIVRVVEKNVKENKSEIPEGTVLHGQTKGTNFFLTVKDGGFYVGVRRFDSLSAAAEGVSGVRRSGWAFWKLPDGKTVKEVYKR